MALPYNPGTVGYGSLVLTINSVAYVAEDISLTIPTRTIERNTELGAPGDFVLIEGRTTGSATLQLATATTVLPTNGQEFSVDLTEAGSTQDYVVSNVSRTFGDEIHKCSIDFMLAE